jgi:uncharacterized membrane protein YccC
MSFRSAFDQLLTVVGVILVVVPVAVSSESWVPIIIVFVGIAMIGLGVWRLGTRLFSNRRVYTGLRSEVEHFIKLVRRLNEHALTGDTQTVEEIKREMKDSVDRMAGVAGQSGGLT